MSNDNDNSILRQLLFSDDIAESSFSYPNNNPNLSDTTHIHQQSCSNNIINDQQIMDRALVIAQLDYFHYNMFYEFDIKQGINPGSDTNNFNDLIELDRRAEILYGRKIFSNPPDNVDEFFKSIRHIPTARQRYQYAKRENSSPQEIKQYNQLLQFEKCLPPNVYFAHVIYQASNHPVHEFLPYNPDDKYNDDNIIPELPDTDIDSNALIEQVLNDFDPYDLPQIY